MNRYTHDFRYDPAQQAPMTPFKLGEYMVYRTMLRDTPMTRYSVRFNDDLLGHQVSMPVIEDCHRLFNAYVGNTRSTTKNALSVAESTVADRIVAALAEAPLTKQQISAALHCPQDFVSPILTRLTKLMRITREGTPGNYVFTQFKAA